MATKVLELSPWEMSVSQSIYPECTVERYDFLSPIPKEFEGQYDALLANNVLQRFNYSMAVPVLASWSTCIKEGGELHVIVPSLEWACREVLSEKPSPACMMVLYGAQGGDNSIHTSGYTMRLLRAHFARVGLNVNRARTSEASVEMNGTVLQFMQHYVSGTKGLLEPTKE